MVFCKLFVAIFFASVFFQGVSAQDLTDEPAGKPRPISPEESMRFFAAENAKKLTPKQREASRNQFQRLFDDAVGRTNLHARFEESNGVKCFVMGGALSFGERSLIMTPHSAELAGIDESNGFESRHVFRLSDCRVVITFSKQILESGTWRQLSASKNQNTLTTFRQFGIRFIDDPQKSCLQGTALLAIAENTVSIVFPNVRSELPFGVEEFRALESKDVVASFHAPACRVRMAIASEVLVDGAWQRLTPTAPLFVEP